MFEKQGSLPKGEVFKFTVIPQKTSVSNFLKMNTNDEKFVETSILWQDEHKPFDFFEEIAFFLPKTTSWSKNLIIYGELDSNCFEVYCKNNEIQEVSFRIDFRENYDIILERLMQLAKKNQLIFLDEEISIVKMEFNYLKSIIHESKQFKKYHDFIKKQYE